MASLTYPMDLPIKLGQFIPRVVDQGVHGMLL